MSSIAPDRLPSTEATGHTPGPGQHTRLTAEAASAAIAELKHATAGWAALLAECAGLVLGYDEDQFDAIRYRQITELCIAAGVDQTLTEAWIEIGRQRATTTTTTAALTHKACVLGELAANILPRRRTIGPGSAPADRNPRPPRPQPGARANKAPVQGHSRTSGPST